LGDGTTWPALNFADRTGSSDLVTQLAVINSQLWVFGQKNIEVWFNAGNAGFPFQRIQGATINQGVVAPFSVAKIQNSVMWLSSDDRGWTSVYYASGLLPVRVSTFAIESLINKTYGTAISSARAHTYEEAGHVFYQLNFSGGTVCYDITTQQWHERAFLNGSTLERSRADCFASVIDFPTGVRNFVGDYATGSIYVQTLQTPADNGLPIRRVRAAPHISDGNRWMKYRRFEVDADIGTAAIQLEISNDGGRNYHNVEPPKTASNNLAVDGFGKFYWLQLGRSRDRVFRTTITDSANSIRLINGYVDANPGTEP
jgi:hypothetical protein